MIWLRQLAIKENITAHVPNDSWCVLLSATEWATQKQKRISKTTQTGNKAL